MRIFINYNNARMNSEFECDDIQYVQGFIVMTNPLSKYGPMDSDLKQLALPIEHMTFISVYDK